MPRDGLIIIWKKIKLIDTFKTNITPTFNDS